MKKILITGASKKTLDWTPPISVKEGIRRMFQKK
jgi:nucleoside-diphosphate-sugar epimerase